MLVCRLLQTRTRAALLALACVALHVGWFGQGSALALEHVRYTADGGERTASGELVTVAADGGLLLLLDDGVLQAIEGDKIVSRKHDDVKLAPLSAEEVGKRLLETLPPGFEVYHTSHYVICYNTSRNYAVWCGGLFERLEKGFVNYWGKKGITLHEPRFPLPAIVFSSKQQYAEHSKDELGERAADIVGYYNMLTNRMTMYDLTGSESVRGSGASRRSAAQINQMLLRPEAEALVATVIHEATHQVSFNTGLQQRMGDTPLWLSEGLAIFFETPDLQSGKGWRTIGALHRSRLDRFRQYLPSRGAGSLSSLLSDDKRLRDPRQAVDGYAESWSLVYYLSKQRPKEFVEYMRVIGAKPPLIWDEPAERLTEFQKAFGPDMAKLDADFLKYMQRAK